MRFTFFAAVVAACNLITTPQASSLVQHQPQLFDEPATIFAQVDPKGPPVDKKKEEKKRGPPADKKKEEPKKKEGPVDKKVELKGPGPKSPAERE